MQQAVKAPGGEHRLTLGEVLDGLIEDKMIGADAAEQLKKERRYYRGTMHPLAIVADQKWKKGNALLTLDALTEWLAKRVGLEYLHIDPLKIDFAAVTEVMSSAYATRFRVLPVGVSAKEAIVATAEPHVREWEAELARISKREIRRVIANPLDIERYQVEFYNLARSIKGANRTASAASGLSNFEQLVELGKSDKQFDANDAHIVRIVDWLWQYAFEQRASDIHIEPRREQGIVRFRLDGVLHQVYQIPAAVLAAMTSRIKILGRMDVVEKRRPQDGRIKTRTLEQADVELRLSTLPTAFGEKIVMRIFDPEVLVRDFRELGFSDDDQKRWNEMTARPNGIVLVTGPTGSGKTTTLYSTLKALATPEVNVCTIEDPIEKVDLQRGEDQEAWDALVAPWKANRPAKICKPVGCLECRMTGYLGRVGIYETLLFSGAIKSLTAKNAELATLREQAMKEGMKPLRISGAMKVAAGVTTIDEVLKVAPPIRDASAG